MTMYLNVLRPIISLACVAVCIGSGPWRSPDYDYQAIGCYAAEYDSVNMEIKAGDAPNMGPATCQELCADYPYYAIHNSRWCYCGHDFANGRSTGIDKCSVLCKGRSRDYCGDRNNMMVYQNTYYEYSWIDARFFSCFKVKDTAPYIMEKKDAKMTVKMCRDICKGYALFGLGYGNACACLYGYYGNDIDVTGSCKSMCAGNKNQTCGGLDSYIYYALKDGFPECNQNQISPKSNRQECIDACVAQPNCKIIGYSESTRNCILMETQCQPPASLHQTTLQLVTAKPGPSRNVTIFPNTDSYECATAGLLPDVKPAVISFDECKALAVATPSARYFEWQTQVELCMLFSSCELEETTDVSKIGGLDNVPPPSLPKGTITVYLNDGNQKPIPNIPITLINKAGAAVFDSKTAADGSVTITIEPGTYSLVPKFPEGTGPAPPNDVAEVVVKPGKNDPLVITFVLDSSVTVQVTLVDGNGIPFANIPVSIYDKDGQLAGQAFTDANGVLVTKLPPGQYVFKPVYPNDRQPANGNGEIDITVPNSYFKPMVINVPTVSPKPVDELQTITVTLVDADGNALPNIPVQIYDKDGNFVDVAVTDDNGVLTVQLPPGEYSLRPAFPPGREPTEGDGLYHIIIGPDNTNFVIDTKVPSVVINGGGGADGDISAYINIIVVDQDGNPIPAMNIGICQPDGKEIQTYMTDATGTFLLRVPAGKYVIVPDYSDFEQPDMTEGTFVIELKPGANQPYTFKAPVSLVTDTVPIDHNTDPFDNWPGQIKGTIYGDDNENNMFDAGEGIPGVDVQLLDDQNRVFAKIKTDSNGAYEFKDVVPGVYTVVIKPSSQIPTAGSQPITKKLNVKSNSTSRFDLRLLGTKNPTSGKLIVLAFVDANGNEQQDAGEAPIVAAPVILTSVDGQEVARGVTDQTGTVTFEDVPFALYGIKLDLASHPEFGTPYVDGRIDMKTSTLRIAFSVQA